MNEEIKQKINDRIKELREMSDYLKNTPKGALALQVQAEKVFLFDLLDMLENPIRLQGGTNGKSKKEANEERQRKKMLIPNRIVLTVAPRTI